MRLLIISDIHGNHTALMTILDEALDIDIILCAGDITGYGPRPNACINTLRNLEAVCIKGNHDKSATTGNTSKLNTIAAKAMKIQLEILKPKNIDWLKKCPKIFTKTLDNLKVYMVHGSPWNPLSEYIYPDIMERLSQELLNYTQTNLLILGHTHIPYIHQTKNGLIINPGSVGQPRDGNPMTSYIILETDPSLKVIHRRIEYDIDNVAEEMRILGIPEMLRSRLYLGR